MKNVQRANKAALFTRENAEIEQESEIRAERRVDDSTKCHTRLSFFIKEKKRIETKIE